MEELRAQNAHIEEDGSASESFGQEDAPEAELCQTEEELQAIASASKEGLPAFEEEDGASEVSREGSELQSPEAGDQTISSGCCGTETPEIKVPLLPIRPYYNE